ncbi:thiamine phosphate synthase [Microbacterium nymphoidis]|uniref:thiamine phosphate synthase n=1 Tax=Microbacterium nymphoidis TaxID=2898586 RepID=UPI001E57B522|nr:thiamine phosphate synthase [Microbacterium nymphoidis]MCD2497400.1 thiamine phosphate synthase [Microbacterium nymphoidis]
MTVSGIYLVTSEPAPGTSLLDVIDAAVDAGVETVQLRAKHVSARDFLDLTGATADVIAGRARLLVNDRVDVVLAARASGVAIDGAHLGQSDLPPAVARALLGRDSVLGLTADTRAHLSALDEAAGIDYLGVGAIHPTSTKPDHPAPLGVAGFADFAADAPLPCVAIGGITVEDVAALRRAGASAIAVASAVCASDDPGRAAADLLTAWTSAGEGR